MISVQLECDDMECFANEYVDVYLDDVYKDAPLSGYVPEGWTLVARDSDGLAITLCPKHSPAKES